MIIAIDGPAGAGKSTTARLVAQALGFDYLDTGAMYRAIALTVSENGWDITRDADQIATLARKIPLEVRGASTCIGARDVSGLIRTPEIGALTSRIAVLPEVRAALVQLQQRLGRESEARCGGAVLEGRDIQTVVFPDAQVKIFLFADTRTRAARRVLEWQSRGESADVSQTAAEFAERDARDSERDTAPLQAAPDAIAISTDDLTPEQVVAHIVNIARERGTENKSVPIL